MTAPRPPAPVPRDRPRWQRPRVLFAALGGLFAIAILFMPQGGRRGDQRLTTYSTEAGGAALLRETTRRLGWTVVRRTTPFAIEDSLDPGALYAVLDPPKPPGARDVHLLLEAVRRGAGLVVVAGREGTLTDSLKIQRSSGGAPQVPETSRVRCPKIDGPFGDKGTIDWPNGRVSSFWLVAKRPLPPDTVSFAAVARTTTRAERDSARPASRRDRGGVPRELAERRETAVMGLPYGRGRIVVVADPDWLRNDVVRVCKWGAGEMALRALEWARPRDGARTLVFDEYHQGYGQGRGMMATIARAAVRTGEGRTVLAGMAALLLLLLAVSPRPVPPRPATRIERRSPLEHVGALARAYEQIGATRLATRRLVRGLRRRHGRTGARHGSDEDFLRALAERHRALVPDVERLLRALATPLPAGEFVAVAAAMDHIDRTLRTT